MRDQVQELWQLVLAYARQETIGPLKGLGRYLAKGILASMAVSLGIFFVLLGLLRLLQTETGSAFDGGWSWVPYVVTIFGCALSAYVAMAIRSKTRGEQY